MRAIDLGTITIAVKPSSTATGLMQIEIACENRKGKVVGQTGPDETVDQLGQRLKGMLRASYNSPAKEQPKPVKVED